MKFGGLVGLALLLAATSADAGWTGTEFYSYCVEGHRKGQYFDLATQIGCRFYLQGIIDGMQYGKALNSKYCLPIPLEFEQAMLVIDKFIREHPDQLSSAVGAEAAGISSLALALAFPCRASPRQR